MPCTFTGSLEGDRALAGSEANQHLTETTQLLCSLCAAVENGTSMPPKVREWWEKHKVVDQEARALAEYERLRKKYGDD